MQKLFKVPFDKLCSNQSKQVVKSTKSVQKANRPPQEDIQGKRCNHFAVTWFWITVIGIIYIGLEYILPEMYENSNVVLCNKIMCYIIIVELLVNWFFLRLVKSPFRVEMHRDYILAHEEEVLNGGYEIDTADMIKDESKVPGTPSTFRLPKSSIIPKCNNNVNNQRPISGTLYVIEMDDTCTTDDIAMSMLSRDRQALSDGNSTYSSLNNHNYGINNERDYGSSNNGLMLTKNSSPTGHNYDHSGNVLNNNHTNLNQGSVNTSNSVGVTRGKRRLVYPYWSWKPCVICKCARPPRTHHCPICSMCVLKRDHHCFFTGSCVGLRNQRYFVTFVFWGVIACLFVTIQSMIYFFTVYVPQDEMHHWIDIILPIGVLKWGLGGYNISLFDISKIILLYSVSWFCITAAAFLREQINCIKRGITSFEQDNRIKIVSMADQKTNLRAVFGEYWHLNFIMPLHWVYPPSDDGISWPHIKV